MVSSEIIFKAETIRRSWGIDNVSPINILSAVLDNVDNLTILWFPMLDDVSGCCAKTDEYKLICINSRHSKGRQNFTIAHELYHLLFEDDKFASSLLMPDIALFEFINKHGIKKWSLSDVIKCEQYFQISHIAMLCKLRREDMISYDDFKAFKTSVKKNALQLGYDLSLYEPTRQYYSLGEIIPLSKKLYDEKRITGGKFDEILLDVFREDLVYNTFEEDDMIV